MDNMLEFRNGVVVRNPRRLFDIARGVACHSLMDGSVIESLPIPLSLKRELRHYIKLYWTIDDTPMFNIHEYPYDEIDFYKMTREQFHMLMHLPYDWIPYFISELFREDEMHVVYQCWIFHTARNTIFYKCCDQCYDTLSAMSAQDVQRLWGEEKRFWRFTYLCYTCVNVHIRMANPKVMHNGDSYCDICLLNPIVQFYTRDECVNELTLHDEENQDDDDTDED